MKRFIAAALVLLLLLGGTPSVSANSAQTYWEGVDRTGVIITDGDCPIVVEHELLTFDLQEFPNYYYDEGYTNKVTAQYTFYNPSDMTVSAKLLFPFGDKNWYYDPDNTLAEQYDILIDGEPVEKKIRHTLSYGGQFDLEQDLSLLSDTFADDTFYSPELPVTVYKFAIYGVDKDTYKNATVAFDLPQGQGDRRYNISNSRGGQLQDNGDIRVVAHFGKNEISFALYVFGEPLSVYPEFHFYKDGGAKDSERISGSTRFSGKETMTFQEFALSGWTEESGISEIDWYNAIVADMNANSRTEHPVIYQLTNQSRLAENMMQWYEYEITVGPGERIVNTVIAPIFPSINTRYNPTLYDYTYLLSPAQTWKSFGTLEIVVNTPYYIIESSLHGFEKTESGYALTLDGLPDGELTFTLCASENPKAPKSSALTSIFYVFVFIFAYIGHIFESIGDFFRNLF